MTQPQELNGRMLDVAPAQARCWISYTVRRAGIPEPTPTPKTWSKKLWSGPTSDFRASGRATSAHGYRVSSRVPISFRSAVDRCELS